MQKVDKSKPKFETLRRYVKIVMKFMGQVIKAKAAQEASRLEAIATRNKKLVS